MIRLFISNEPEIQQIWNCDFTYGLYATDNQNVWRGVGVTPQPFGPLKEGVCIPDWSVPNAGIETDINLEVGTYRFDITTTDFGFGTSGNMYVQLLDANDVVIDNYTIYSTGVHTFVANATTPLSKIRISADSNCSLGFTHIVFNRVKTEWCELDVINDESLILERQFKNQGDITSTQYDYSINVTLPTSEKNNKLIGLTHLPYVEESEYIIGKRYDCRIDTGLFNNIFGMLKISSVNFIGNVAYSYECTFYNEFINVNNRFGDETLADNYEHQDRNVNFAEYSFIIDDNTVYDRLKNAGLYTNGSQMMLINKGNEGEHNVSVNITQPLSYKSPTPYIYANELIYKMFAVDGLNVQSNFLTGQNNGSYGLSDTDYPFRFTNVVLPDKRVQFSSIDSNKELVHLSTSTNTVSYSGLNNMDNKTDILAGNYFGTFIDVRSTHNVGGWAITPIEQYVLDSSVLPSTTTIPVLDWKVVRASVKYRTRLLLNFEVPHGQSVTVESNTADSAFIRSRVRKYYSPNDSEIIYEDEQEIDLSAWIQGATTFEVVGGYDRYHIDLGEVSFDYITPDFPVDPNCSIRIETVLIAPGWQNIHRHLPEDYPFLVKHAGASMPAEDYYYTTCMGSPFDPNDVYEGDIRISCGGHTEHYYNPTSIAMNEMKKIDYIRGIYKMFNLFTQSIDNRKIEIETTNAILTDKSFITIDEAEVIGCEENEYTENYTFEYESDDELNTSYYKTLTDAEWGERIYEKDYSKDAHSESITVPFAPTANVQYRVDVGYGWILNESPFVGKEGDGKIDFKQRILYKSPDDTALVRLDIGTYYIDEIPYYGHFNRGGGNDSVDLNFNTCSWYYQDMGGTLGTWNNLFNVFHYPMIKQMANNKKYTITLPLKRFDDYMRTHMILFKNEYYIPLSTEIELSNDCLVTLTAIKRKNLAGELVTVPKSLNIINPRTEQSDNIRNIIDGKQDALVSGKNIVTINGQSLLGSGDLQIGGGGGKQGFDFLFSTNGYQSGTYDTTFTLNDRCYEAIDVDNDIHIRLVSDNKSDNILFVRNISGTQVKVIIDEVSFRGATVTGLVAKPQNIVVDPNKATEIGLITDGNFAVITAYENLQF